MNIADLATAGPEDLGLWARTAPKGEAARYGETLLAVARALAERGLVLLVQRREAGALQRLAVRR